MMKQLILLLCFFCFNYCNPSEKCLLMHENKCITLHSDVVTYPKATEICKKIHGNLVIINSQSKQELLNNELENFKKSEYWIGLSDITEEGIWIHDDGRPLGLFSNWEPKEPNNLDNEDCVVLTKYGKWNDVPCATYESNVLCEHQSFASCNYENVSLPNATFEKCLQSTTVPHGYSFTFECHTGYDAREGNTVECNNGIWLTFGSCKPICERPEDSEDMFLDSNTSSFVIGEQAVFICRNGFFLKENKPVLKNVKTCVGVDEWAPDFLQCIPSDHFVMSNPGDIQEKIILNYFHGDTLILNCSNESDEDKKQKIENIWWKNGRKLFWYFFENVNYIISETGQLKLVNLTTSDEGIYTCITVKQQTKEFQTLIVYQLESTNKTCISTSKANHIQFNKNEYAVLACPMFYFLESTLIWFKNNVELGYENDHHLFLPDGSLLIKKIDFQDSGKYTCEIVNKISSCAITTTYFVSVKPALESVCGTLAKNNGVLHPWFVSFWWDDEEKPFCYGSIIATNWVGTSASCVQNIRRRMYSHIYVQIGFNRNFSFDETSVFSIESIVVHPRYSKRIFVNDFALIKLTKPLSLQEGIGILCLMTKEIENTWKYQRQCEHPKDHMGYVPGLGPIEGIEHVPKTDHMLIMPSNKCNPTDSFSSTDFIFCATQVEKDSSSLAGDIGSPFVIEIKNRFYLYGVYTWGERISSVGKFDYFTKISAYSEWIFNQMKK